MALNRRQVIMDSFLSYSRVLLLGLLCMVHSACQHGEPGDSVAPGANNGNSSGPVNSPKAKPGAPLVYDYELKTPVIAGIPFTLVLKPRTPLTSGILSVNVDGGSGLNLLSETQQFEVDLAVIAAADGTVEGSIKWILQLLAPDSGRFYLDLRSTVVADEGSFSRASSIAIEVLPEKPVNQPGG